MEDGGGGLVAEGEEGYLVGEVLEPNFLEARGTGGGVDARTHLQTCENPLQTVVTSRKHPI